MHAIEQLIESYDRGGLTRRQLMQALLTLAVPAAAAAQQPATSVFRGHSLNHVKVITADVNRSRRFYETLLGVTPGRPTATGLGGQHLDLPSGLGNISLEPPRVGERPGVIEHFAVSVDNYVRDTVAAVQRAIPDVKVHTEQESGAIFFLDPDGAWVQITSRPSQGE